MSRMTGSVEHPIVYFDEKGNGPIHHVCGDGDGEFAERRVQQWLDRQRLTGSITPEVARAVEELIEWLA